MNNIAICSGANKMTLVKNFSSFLSFTFLIMIIFSLNAESKTLHTVKKFQLIDTENGIILAKCKQKDWVKKKACQAKEAAEKKARQAREKAEAAKRRAEEEARRRAAEAKKRAEEAAKKAAEAKKRAEEEARRRAAAAKKKAEDEARKRAAAAKKKAEDEARKAADAAKKAGAGLSAAYLASYKYATPYVNTTADLAKDLGNDAAKFVKAQFDKWGCFATVGAITQPATAKAMLKKVLPILEKRMNTDLKIASLNLSDNSSSVYLSSLTGSNQFFQKNYFSTYEGLPDYNGLIKASFVNPLSTKVMSSSSVEDSGIVLVNKKKKKCGKKCKAKKRKAKARAKAAKKKQKEQAKKDRLKKKAQEKKLAKEKKLKEKKIAKEKRLNKGKTATATTGTGAAIAVGSAAAAAGYGKTYKPVKIDTSTPLKLAESTALVIKKNKKGYTQLVTGIGKAAVRIPFMYDQILNADFICNKSGKEQVKVLKQLKLFPNKGIKFASADDNRIFASLDNLKNLSNIDLKNLLISSANAADGGKAKDPAEPFFGIELGLGVEGSLGVGAGVSVAFNLITDMDNEVYSFFTVSKDQVLNIGLPSQVTLEGCVGPSLKIFGTPPTKVSGFKGIGHSVGFEMTGEVEYFEAFSADAGVGVDIGISSLKSGSQFTGMSIGPVASACAEGPDSDLPVAVALVASTSWSYRLW